MTVAVQQCILARVGIEPNVRATSAVLHSEALLCPDEAEVRRLLQQISMNMQAVISKLTAQCSAKAVIFLLPSTHCPLALAQVKSACNSIDQNLPPDPSCSECFWCLVF